MSAPSTTSTALLASLFRGLADTARLSCLLAVRERECTVNEVAAATRLSQPNVSKHLACLRDCGLVQSRRSGKYVYYALSDAGVEQVLQSAEAFLVGLALNALFHWWWAEDIAALVFLFWLVQETREALEEARSGKEEDDDD